MNKLSKKIIAIASAILMVVSMIPMGTAKEAYAAETTGTTGKIVFYPTHLASSEITDKALVADGTVFENAVKVNGKARYRLAEDGTVSRLEIARAGEGSLTFTVTDTSDITLVVSSTGAGVSSHVSLVNAEGTAVATDADKTDVAVSTLEPTTLTYASVPAGTYTVTAPAVPDGNTDDSYYRNFCFYGLKVIPEGSEQTGVVTGPQTYTVVMSTDVSVSGYEVSSDGKALAAEGTTFANGFFKLVSNPISKEDGTVVTDGKNYFRTPSKSDLTSFKSIELAKAEGGKILFTTTAVSDAEFSVSSTGSSNSSAVALLDSTGAVVANTEGLTVVTGTGATTITYKELPAGTYTLVSPLDSSMNRGVRVLSAKVVEQASSESQGSGETVENKYSFAATDLTAAADKEAVDEGTSFADGFFKITGTGTVKRFKNDAVYAMEIAKAEASAFTFTIAGEGSATFTVSSTGSSNESAVALKTDTDAAVATTDGVETVIAAGTSAVTITYTNLPAGTYKLVSPADETRNRGFRLMTAEVTDKVSADAPVKVAKEWGEVTAPVITGAECTNGKLVVSYNMEVGFDGADSVTVNMYDANGALIDTKVSYVEGTTGSVSFAPASSGTYTFDITAARSNETAVTNKSNVAGNYLLPLTAVNVQSATSQGKGTVEVVWDAVTEATAYQVYYKLSSDTEYKKADVIVSDLSAKVTGLTVGEHYDFAVAALRGEEEGPMGTAVSTKATADAQRVWAFTAYGPSTSLSTNLYTGSYLDGTVNLQSTGGKGKIQPATVDGLAFYYTTINPKTENFKLTARIHVNSWTYSNGQEGFGLMAADTIGTSGDTTELWNNSYMAIVSKVEYYYKAIDDETGILNGTDGTKTSMKLGIGALARLGATAANIADGSLAKNVSTLYSSTMRTLESSMKDYKGPFNIIGNSTNEVEGTQKTTYTDFIFTIEQNNSGFYISYTNVKTGETTTEMFWDTERNSLTQIDPDNIYVGFFAARNADITITDMKLTTSNPATDAAADTREIVEQDVTVAISQPQYTGNDSCTALIMPNADGTLKVTDSDGNVIFPETEVKANVYTEVPYTVQDGYNKFTYTFTPAADFKFDEYTIPSSYNPTIASFNTIKRTFSEKVIYVEPGIALGSTGTTGTKDDPTDILSAFRYAVAGQIIVLGNGEYHIDANTELRVERGNDGTEDNPIIVMGELDADSDERPVIDFQKVAKGVTFGGNYWILSGFDVTNSLDGQKGLQLSGSHCVVQDVNAYNNGNTGIQISRYNTNDLPDSGLWPSYNTILNCTSYNNADSGYEDADGFACKLTTGDGNVFDGCIAHHNADDGWDFFAKLETGSIGAVTIQNCVAYANGYLLDGTVAGNGNGFKMGGSSLSGHHVIKNSVAFGNKAKGIDSNSCPDIEVYNCTSFDNGSYNYAFYTSGSVADTAYVSQNNVSFRTSSAVQLEDQIKLKGTQNEKSVYNDSSYFYATAGGDSKNYAGAKVTSDWFVTLDYATVLPTRNADGTINMNGLAELTSVASVGAAINQANGTATVDLSATLEAAIGTEPEVTPTPEPTAEPTAAPTAEPTQTPAPTEEPAAEDNGGMPVGGIVAIIIVAVAAIGAAVFFTLKKKKGTAPKKKNK